mmetsp:Transcript_2742/g.10064  ORF Transcript_2742/g.10064 Transcript_2742/m.10064 type:complete len:337 (+) Transcript_2742:84-1094(+)
MSGLSTVDPSPAPVAESLVDSDSPQPPHSPSLKSPSSPSPDGAPSAAAGPAAAPADPAAAGAAAEADQSTSRGYFADILIQLNGGWDASWAPADAPMDDLLGQQVAIVIDEGDVQLGCVVEGPGQEGKLRVVWESDGSSSWHSREFVLRTAVDERTAVDGPPSPRGLAGHAGGADANPDAPVPTKAPAAAAFARKRAASAGDGPSTKQARPAGDGRPRGRPRTEDRPRADELPAVAASLQAAAQLALGNSGSAVGRSLTDKEQCAILEAWCIDHIGFPYPTAEEREQLESATRMGEKQMKDWFNNVRKRKIIPVVNQRRPPRSAFEHLVAEISTRP